MADLVTLAQWALLVIMVQNMVLIVFIIFFNKPRKGKQGPQGLMGPRGMIGEPGITKNEFFIMLSEFLNVVNSKEDDRILGEQLKKKKSFKELLDEKMKKDV